MYSFTNQTKLEKLCSQKGINRKNKNERNYSVNLRSLYKRRNPLGRGNYQRKCLSYSQSFNKKNIFCSFVSINLLLRLFGFITTIFNAIFLYLIPILSYFFNTGTGGHELSKTTGNAGARVACGNTSIIHIIYGQKFPSINHNVLQESSPLHT